MNLDYFGKQVIFTELSFNCSGLLTHWIFTASSVHNNQESLPELQVWRSNQITNTYRLVHSTLMDSASSTGTNQLYNMSLISNPLLVQAGDILGIFQPKKMKSSFSISYSNSNSGFTTTIHSIKTKTHLTTFSISSTSAEVVTAGIPLVTAVIGKNN